MIRLVLAAMLIAATPAVAQQRTLDAAVEAAIEEAIQPGFADFSARAATLAGSLEALCAAPDPERLAAVREQFGHVVEGWSRVEIFRFGPLTAENRTERILFWPDRRGIGLRQVQGLLAEDETATDPATLRDKSVALQGLAALEFVLFGSGADEVLTAEGDFRCRYGAAIAASIAGVADELSAAWREPGGIADRMMDPSPDDPAYRTEREAVEELVGAASHGLEAIRDTRLLPFVGREPGDDPNPRSALFWRSGLTMRAIAANIEGIERLFEASGIADASPVAADARYVDEATRFEFANAHRGLSLVTDDVAVALDDARQLQALRYLVIVTQSLQTLIGEQLPAALGLSVGFSSLDGD